MKGFWIILIVFLLGLSGSLSAQTVQINYEPRKIDFPDPVNVVFNSFRHCPSDIFDIYNFPCGTKERSMVFKTPVCYTAFFCKMEVTTQKAFGIMLKVHAGDYDSYMDQKIPR
jgi:hypothetical protein